MTKAYYIPNGPKNLIPLFPSINFEDLSRYYVEVLDTDGDVVATTNINQLGGCCEDDKIRIHFLNALGGIDAINFKRLTETHEVKGDLYERPVAYPLVKSDHAINRFNVRGNDTITIVTTDFSETDKDWLTELFDSPLAWMEWTGDEGQDDSYIPVTVLDKQFPKVTQEDRFNYQVTLDIRLSHERFIIRN